MSQHSASLSDAATTQGDARAAEGCWWEFCCPRERAPLLRHEASLVCSVCSTVYPIVGGVPVLINDDNSVFAIADFAAGPGYWGASYGRSPDATEGLRHRWRRWVLRIRDAGSNIPCLSWDDAVRRVAAVVPTPRVLALGSGGRDFCVSGARVLHTDVAFDQHVAAIVDAHDIPLPDGCVDMVVAAAVLEHVADPQRCVAEIRRVLRPGGYVYAVTPFLQRVHMGAYDFTRFTLLGHRRLFRWFDVIDAGVAAGVGSVAADALESLLKSVSDKRLLRNIGGLIALPFRPPLRKLDRWLVGAAHFDAAGGCYFFGRLRNTPVPDRMLIQEYRGAYRRPLGDRDTTHQNATDPASGPAVATGSDASPHG